MEAIKNNLLKRWWLLLIIWALVPLFIRGTYILNILIMVLVYILLTQSMNFVMGMAGQSQLGQIAFFGIGAYIAALLMVLKGTSFWMTLPFAFIGAGAAGLIVGLPSLRVSGDYLGIVTFGFGEIVREIFTNWTSLTRGPMGITSIPSPTLFSYTFNSKASYFYLATVLAIFTWFILDRLANSKLGLQLLAVQADERCADVLGVRTGKAKLLAFLISGAFAGLGGAFYASYFSFISPDSFLFMGTLTVLCMLVVGGMGNLVGCAIGATILEFGPEAFRALGDYRMLIYGLLVIIVVIYKPSGIWGMDKRRRNAICIAAARVKP
jgi:branched-chain amino acid transport system permease protein